MVKVQLDVISWIVYVNNNVYLNRNTYFVNVRRYTFLEQPHWCPRHMYIKGNQLLFRLWLCIWSWLGNIVDGWWKKNLHYFCMKCYLLYSFYCTNPLTCTNSNINSQNTNIFMVFLEGVSVQHPLTVNFPNHFWIFPTVFHENKT